MQQYFRFNELLQQSQGEIPSAELKEKGVTLRKSATDILRTDGPYSTGAEMVGGFYLVHAESLEEATELAGNVPMVSGDTVEIRPVMTDLDRPEALRAANLR